MSMYKRAPVESEIQAAFDRALDHLHLGIPTDAGFSPQTYSALVAAAMQPDNESLRSRARVELKKQLRGEHDADDEELWDEVLRNMRG